MPHPASTRERATILHACLAVLVSRSEVYVLQDTERMSRNCTMQAAAIIAGIDAAKDAQVKARTLTLQAKKQAQIEPYHNPKSPKSPTSERTIRYLCDLRLLGPIAGLCLPT